MSRIIVIVAAVLGVAAMAEASGSKPHTSLGPIKQIDAGVLSVGYAEAGPADGSPIRKPHTLQPGCCESFSLKRESPPPPGTTAGPPLEQTRRAWLSPPKIRGGGGAPPAAPRNPTRGKKRFLGDPPSRFQPSP